MIRVAVALTVVAVGAACASHPQQAASSPTNQRQTLCDSCSVPVAEGVSLSPAELCVLGAYRRRCQTHDPCIINCLANRNDEVVFPDGTRGRIGGGCWHLCFAYTGIDWTLPDDAKSCDTLPGFGRVGSLLPNKRLKLTARVD